jgi:hypothetical protein
VEIISVDDSLVHAKLDEKYYVLGEKWGTVAKTLGFYPSYLSDVRSGRRAPGPKLLKLLHLERKVIVQYVELER